jgi:hypothetical protein
VYLSFINPKDSLQFTAQDITVQYLAGTRILEFWSHSLMSCAWNIVEDSDLAKLCKWDVMRLEKFDGKAWIPFIHEPWSATHMWNMQVSKFSCVNLSILVNIDKSELPDDGKPLCITLYADKTQLSSFGSAQGYPIIAQINNLPHEVRNGKGLGASQVVGWLPIVCANCAQSCSRLTLCSGF